MIFLTNELNPEKKQLMHCFNLECNKPFYKWKTELERYPKRRFFCSPTCFYKIKKDAEPTNSRKKYRQRALKHYGEKCSNLECLLTLKEIPIPKEMLDVDHIDGNRSNDSIENLQVLCVWCHNSKTRLSLNTSNTAKRIICNETLITYSSISRAADALGVTRRAVLNQLQGLVRAVRGFTFSFVDP